MPKHILVVEDSPTQALKAQLTLEDSGYQVSLAENGQTALELALQNPPDLILTDVNMPVMDGYVFTRYIKTDPALRHVPVLMLTSLNQPLDVLRGLEAGADHFMIKPYADQELLQRINDLFAAFELAQAGRQPELQQVESFQQQIILTRQREQILQSLLQACANILDCQTLAMLIVHPDGDRPLLVVSYCKLDTATLLNIGNNLGDLLMRIQHLTESAIPNQIIPILLPDSNAVPCQPDPLRSYLNAPLITEGRVVGMLGAFSSRPNAFDLKHIGFLFEMGQSAAQALSKLKVEV